MTKSHKIGFLGYDGVQLLDIAGPLESFALVNEQQPGICYETAIVAPNRAFKTETGVTVQADYLLQQAPCFDTLIIPGGYGARDTINRPILREWVASRFDGCKRVATVCTGIFILADMSQLSGLNVTTHWDYASELQQCFPQLRVEPDRLFIQQGQFYSSAGVLSGIDLTLHIIEQDHGIDCAARVAKYLVTHLRRSGHQSQFSETLKFQSVNNDRLQKLCSWLIENLHSPYSVADIAYHNHVSERHLNRLIKQHFKMTTKSWLEHMRQEQAKIYLRKSGTSIKSVAYQVGYRSADSFRRAFKRKYGIEPGAYQRYFS